jgi:hypothetical protein
MVFRFRRMTHRGTATVVSIEHRPHSSRDTDSQGRHSSVYDLILDVYPDGAPPFRTETHQRFAEALLPMPGVTLTVSCNPDKRTVEIDVSHDARFNRKLHDAERARTQAADHEALLSAAPGTSDPRFSDEPAADRETSD